MRIVPMLFRGSFIFAAVGAIACGGDSATESVPQATQFVIVDPTDGVVGTPITVTVEARDASGNVFTAENRDVTLAVSGSATGGGVVDIVNGTGTIAISDNVAETVNLSLQDSEGTGLTVSSTQSVVFAAGPAARFVILDPTDGVAGTPIGVTVQARDAFDNVAASTAQLTLVADGSATGAGVFTLASGTTTININDNVEETVNLSLQDVPDATGLDVTSTQDVVFGPTGATQFVILKPANAQTGSSMTVTVEARDGAGVRATLENRDVTLVTDGAATGGGVVDIVAGVGSLSIDNAVQETTTFSLLDHLGLGLDVTSTETGLFTGPAAMLQFRTIAGGGADASITVEVEVQDAAGNITSSATPVVIDFGSNPGAMLFHASGGLLEHVDHVSPQVLTPALAVLSSNEVVGLTYDAGAGLVVGSLLSGEIVTYDPRSGQEALVGSSGLDFGPTGLAYESGGANRLFAVAASVSTENDLHEVNSSTGAATSIGTLTSTFNFAGFTGLATDPTDGTIYGVAKDAQSGKVRHLVSIDPSTFIMTDIGVFAQNGVADITVTPDGTLLAVTGDGGNPPETVYAVDKTDASTTLVIALGNGDDGEALTYIPAQLLGTLSVTPINGVATFSVQIPAPANGYTLTATSTGLTAATSGAFDITP